MSNTSSDAIAFTAASNPTDSSSSSPSMQNGGQGGSGTTTVDSSPPDDSSTSTPQHHNHQQSTSKKRRSNIQLNKDDQPKGDDGDSSDEDGAKTGDLNDEGGNRRDLFQRASEDVLQKRKMVRASLSPEWTVAADGKNNGDTPTTSGEGLFALVNLAPTRSSGEAPEDSGPSSSSSASKPTSAFVLGTHTPAFGSVTVGVGVGTVAAAVNNGVQSGFASGFGKVASGDDASMSSSKASSFGGGFGSGFGTVSGGFGSLKSLSSSTFGSSFGSTSNKAIATTNALSPSDVLASNNGDGDTSKFVKSPTEVSSSYDATPESSPNTKFPITDVVDTANGEQDEECLCQIRARLYKMVPEDECTNSAVEDQDAAVPSVPSTQRNLVLVTKVKGGKEEDGSTTDEAKESKGETEESAPTKPKLVQKEAGLGPVRVLKCKIHNKEEQQTSARIVQRQETSGGGAFRVILNVRLESKSCTFNRRGDKFVQLNALNNTGLIESYLFKVKTTADADTLENILKDALQI